MYLQRFYFSLALQRSAKVKFPFVQAKRLVVKICPLWFTKSLHLFWSKPKISTRSAIWEIPVNKTHSEIALIGHPYINTKKTMKRVPCRQECTTSTRPHDALKQNRPRNEFIRNWLTDKHTNQRNRLKLYLKEVIEKQEEIKRNTHVQTILQNQDTMWKWIILMIDVDKNFIDIKEKTTLDDSNRRIQVIAFQCEEIKTDGFS